MNFLCLTFGAQFTKRRLFFLPVIIHKILTQLKFKSRNEINCQNIFLSENLMLTLCHYPMVTRNNKPHGSIMLHGHCHGKLDEHNRLSNDLRFDVGIDGELAKRAEGFIPLELVYEVAMEKTGGVPFMCPMLAH